MLNGLDLFSGIGGLTIALEPYVRPIAYCENDRYAQSVLLSRMRSGDIPNAPIWDDIQTLNGPALPFLPDIIYGGFPCQDISIAGTGVGLEGERSKLFFEIMRLVGDIRPRFVFLENVPAISIRGLERICLEFASLGFDCRWTTISAAESGAPHRRDRWFFLAHSTRKGLSQSWAFSPETRATDRPSGNPAELLVQRELWKKSPSDICRMDDGLSPKTHRIRALGNAVVPIQARTAFEKLAGLTRS